LSTSLDVVKKDLVKTKQHTDSVAIFINDLRYFALGHSYLRRTEELIRDIDKTIGRLEHYLNDLESRKAAVVKGLEEMQDKSAITVSF
jgi:hypothetical protein